MSNEYNEEKDLIEKQIQGLSGINSAGAIILTERYINILNLIEKQRPRKVIVSPHGVAFCPKCSGSVWQDADELSMWSEIGVVNYDRI